MDNEIETKLAVHVSPNASKNEIVSFDNGILRIKVAAPPVKGKANAELVSFLAGVLNISKRGVIIVRGANSRNKLISIEGLSEEDMACRLELFASQGKVRM